MNSNLINFEQSLCTTSFGQSQQRVLAVADKYHLANASDTMTKVHIKALINKICCTFLEKGAHNIDICERREERLILGAKRYDRTRKLS